MAEKKEELPPLTAAEVSRDLIRWSFKAITWLIPIAALVWICMQIFCKQTAESLTKPETFLDSYSKFAIEFTDVASPLPSPKQVDAWLDFFDKESRDLFEENQSRMALRSRFGNTGAMEGKSSETTRMEAMSFAVTIFPLNGRYTVRRMELNPEGTEAKAIIETGSRELEVVIRKDGRRWVFTNFAGAAEALGIRR